MSRLINADMLKLEYENGTGITEEEKQFSYALIDAQPTAYDPDKVVEKLEEVKNKDTEIALDEAQKERCFWYAQGMNRAIEIVKGGGVE